MNEHETHIQSNAERKAKIRERYKGIDREELEVIPAIKELSLQEDESEKRVGVYARVSTDDPNQTSSYELQKNHFQDMVNRHPGWKLVEIYADEGISGTSLNHRDSFNRMIADCEAGKLEISPLKLIQAHSGEHPQKSLEIRHFGRAACFFYARNDRCSAH